MKGGSGSCDPLSVENRRALSGPRCGAVTKRWILPLHPPLAMPFPLFFVLESGPNMLPAGRGSSLDTSCRYRYYLIVLGALEGLHGPTQSEWRYTAHQASPPPSRGTRDTRCHLQHCPESLNPSPSLSTPSRAQVLPLESCARNTPQYFLHILYAFPPVTWENLVPLLGVCHNTVLPGS